MTDIGREAGRCDLIRTDGSSELESEVKGARIDLEQMAPGGTASRIDLEQMAPGRMASRSAELEPYGHLRRTSPATEPLRRTLSWFAKLPPDVQPFVLLRRYARVANLIAATWHDPRLVGTYLESLLVDRRGGRRGFPPNVRRELQALQKYRLSRKPRS